MAVAGVLVALEALPLVRVHDYDHHEDEHDDDYDYHHDNDHDNDHDDSDSADDKHNYEGDNCVVLLQNLQNLQQQQNQLSSQYRPSDPANVWSDLASKL